MNFATLAALAVGLFIVAPVVAHLLKRGRTEHIQFPPARLVPKAPATSRKRSRLEDRALLAIRGAMVAALAVLGATPLVTCSRLSVARPSGGNVALAIVLDDSQSMRNSTEDDRSRWETAHEGARQLLGSTRQGDSISIVLAGYPARAALPPTTDLTLAAQALDELAVSDRNTDLGAALQLARSALENLPQADKRIVVLSDLAGAALPDGEPKPWLPLPELRQAQSNCGIASAEQRGKYAEVTVACSNQRAAADRRLKLLDGKGKEIDLGAGDSQRAAPVPSAPASSARATTEPAPTHSVVSADGAAEPVLRPRPGVQALTLALPETPDGYQGFSLELSGKDDNARDDTAPLSSAEASLNIAIVADPDRGLANTGGSLVEQGLVAIDPHLNLRPLALMPQEATDLEGFAAIIVDDPPGLSPEARLALDEWLRTGGVALGLLGPAAASSQLASNLVPFADGAVRWEEISDVSVLPESVAWMGDEGDSLSALTRLGRLRLDGAVPTGAVSLGLWEDRVPWLFERGVGQGKVISVGLPSSVQHSDLALRPGFLALLSYVVGQAELRTGPRRSQAGSSWTFPSGTNLSVKGPGGPLELVRGDACRATTPDESCQGEEQLAQLALAGRYEVVIDGQREERVVTIAPEELTELPAEGAAAASAQALTNDAATEIDVSREIALLLLALFAAELAFRVFGRGRASETGSPTPAKV